MGVVLRTLLKTVGVAILFLNMGCSVNILSSFADKTSDAALYEAALEDMNANNYSGALSAITSMTSTYAASSKVLTLQASAYAGLGGFNFITFAQAFSSFSTLLFPFLLKNFDYASATAIDNSLNAQNVLESIGSISQRSTDQNIFLALVSLAKIGNILSYYADPTKTGAGATGFDPCQVGATRTSGGITDADAREIGTGLSLAIANLTVVSGSLNLGSSTVTTLNSVCTQLPPGYDFCGVTDPTLLTANEVLGIRSLIKESTTVGLGTNCTGDVTVCFCP